jgi:hypothetical protein
MPEPTRVRADRSREPVLAVFRGPEGNQTLYYSESHRDENNPWGPCRRWGNKFSHSRPVNPRVVAHRHPGWQLVLGHLAPDLRYAVYEAAEDRPEYAGEATIYIATPDRSWAVAEYTSAGGPYETERAGARDLWAEVGAAWDAWCTAGRPSRDQLGVTVDVTGTHLWIDKPSASRSLKS